MEQPAALEVEFDARGVWLGDLWTGRLTVRKAAVIASTIPAGSPVWAGTDAVWTTTDHLLAGVIDQVAVLRWQQSGSKGQVPDDILITRPAEAEAKRVDELKHALAQLDWEQSVAEKIRRIRGGRGGV